MASLTNDFFVTHLNGVIDVAAWLDMPENFADVLKDACGFGCVRAAFDAEISRWRLSANRGAPQ